MGVTWKDNLNVGILKMMLYGQGAVDEAHLVECLSAIEFDPALGQTQVRYIHRNPSTQEVKAEGSEVYGHLWLHREFEVTLGYMNACLKLF